MLLTFNPIQQLDNLLQTTIMWQLTREGEAELVIAKKSTALKVQQLLKELDIEVFIAASTIGYYLQRVPKFQIKFGFVDDIAYEIKLSKKSLEHLQNLHLKFNNSNNFELTGTSHVSE